MSGMAHYSLLLPSPSFDDSFGAAPGPHKLDGAALDRARIPIGGGGRRTPPSMGGGVGEYEGGGGGGGGRGQGGPDLGGSLGAAPALTSASQRKYAYGAAADAYKSATPEQQAQLTGAAAGAIVSV